jgi:FemAB-related protein (PEP-CTERM system-associated)
VDGGGAIAGVLPMVEMKSRLFGHFLVSLPYFNYGGVLAKTPEAATELLRAAAEVAHQTGSDFLELRQGEEMQSEWPSISAKVAMIVELRGVDAEAYLKAIGSRMRNKIKHAEKHGLRTEWGGSEKLDDFYSVFAENMRDLGTPVYPKAWFASVLRNAGDQCRLMCIYDGAKCVATTLVTRFRDQMELPWIASTAEARKHYSTVLLYWKAIEWALRQGIAQVDFGRCSPGSGTYQFKKQWKPREVPLRWYYHLHRATAIPEIRPSNPKYRLSIWAWKKLPLFVANRVGPKIVRNIP